MKTIKKGLSIALVILFISLSFTPSIIANVGKEALIEFTTEVCGLDGRKQTVKLTQEEVDEVEALYKSVLEKLNKTKSRKEAEEVFKQAVVELDKYGLLGGLSVKQAQKLVTGGYQESRVIRLLEKLYGKTQNDEYSNSYCLIAGISIGSSFFNKRLMSEISWLYKFEENITYNNSLLIMYYFLLLILVFFQNWIGDLRILNFSNHIFLPYPEDKRRSIIFSVGLNGIKLWRGYLTGNISLEIYPGYYLEPAVAGFTGLKLPILGESSIPDPPYPYFFAQGHFYFGSALQIKVRKL